MDILEKIDLMIGEAKRRDMTQTEQRKVLNQWKKLVTKVGLKSKISKYKNDDFVAELQLEIYHNKEAYYDDSSFIVIPRTFDEVHVMEGTGGWESDFDNEDTFMKFLKGTIDFLKGESRNFPTKGF